MEAPAGIEVAQQGDGIGDRQPGSNRVAAMGALAVGVLETRLQRGLLVVGGLSAWHVTPAVLARRPQAGAARQRGARAEKGAVEVDVEAAHADIVAHGARAWSGGGTCAPPTRLMQACDVRR